MRRARFWFRVDGAAEHFTVGVLPGDSAASVARSVVFLVERVRGVRLSDAKLITGRYLSGVAA